MNKKQQVLNQCCDRHIKKQRITTKKGNNKQANTTKTKHKRKEQHQNQQIQKKQKQTL